MSTSKTFDMDYQKKLTLSPLEKYELYNKFPWQMILHTLLIIFTTIQVLCVLDELTAQNRAQHMILKHILLNQDEDSDEVQFFSLEDFQNQMTTMIENLNTLDEVLFQKINLDDANFQFNVFYSSFDTNNANKTIFHVDVSDPILQPFDISSIDSIKQLIQTVQRIEFEGDQIQHLIKFRDIAGEESCINWKFKISYKFDKIGVIKTKIETSNSNCSIDNNKQSGQDFLLIHFIVFILGSISIITTIQYLYDLGSEYLYNKQMYKDIKSIIETEKLNENDQQDVIQQSPQMGVKFSQAWRNIDYQQDVKQFDNWYIVNALGGFFQVVGATIAILDQILTNDLSIYKFQVAMMGFGCFLAWLLLLQYLEYFQDISLVTWTLRKSSKNIVMFIISILPFFFGFVYLAQAIFWKYNYFETTIDTILSLFALSNGDILLETFNLVKPIGVFGQIFIIVFMIVFFTAVQSVLIAIIMEGYDEINDQRKKQDKEEEKMKDQISKQIEKEQNEISLKARNDDNDEDDDDKEIVIQKLNLQMKRIDKMLEDLDLIADEIDNADIKQAEKKY